MHVVGTEKSSRQHFVDNAEPSTWKASAVHYSQKSVASARRRSSRKFLCSRAPSCARTCATPPLLRPTSIAEEDDFATGDTIAAN